MNAGDRSRVRLLDKLAKQNGWRSLCVVGVKDDLEAKSLISWSNRLNVTIVWEQRDVRTRQERGRQQRACARMRRWEETTKRLSLVEMSCADAADHLEGEQFDAVALWGLSPAQLAADGAKWAALVRDGGSLVGTGHRLPEVRGILNAAVPKWRQLRDGVWLVEVKRTVQPDAAKADGDDAGAGGTDSGAEVPGSPVQGALGSGTVVGDAVAESAEVFEAEEAAAAAGQTPGDVLPDVLGAGVADAPDPALAVSGSELHADTIAQPAPKRRGGRPKGSRNKPKVATGA